MRHHGLVAGVVWAACLIYMPTASAEHQQARGPVTLTDSEQPAPESAPGEPGKAAPVVFDVTLHDRNEIGKLLQRAEELAMTPQPADRPQKIVLVLHGDEIEYFRISNYRQNQDIIDLAAKLDAFNVIDVKMCGTMMEQRHITEQDIPAFIEVVPYAPTELEKLQEKGFLKL